jgi:hypothetical protein
MAHEYEARAEAEDEHARFGESIVEERTKEPGEPNAVQQ